MKNTINDGYIIDASIELIPRISISPFRTPQLIGYTDDAFQKTDSYFCKRFGNYKIFTKARDAIEAVLCYYKVKKNDVVTILTTSGNFYISSCVTKAIEKHCKWNRELSKDTTLIFINHEFGYPFKGTEAEKLQKFVRGGYQGPIIEDCAHTFFSDDKVIGSYGDFVIYSLPKAFPMQIGALVTSKNNSLVDIQSCKEEVVSYVYAHFAPNILPLTQVKKQRVQNYLWLEENLAPLGISPYFDDCKISEDDVIPSVYLFKWDREMDLPALKEYMQGNGVECSVFYGENAFYIPCNETLSIDELRYMVDLIKYFCSQDYSCAYPPM